MKDAVAASHIEPAQTSLRVQATRGTQFSYQLTPGGPVTVRLRGTVGEADLINISR